MKSPLALFVSDFGAPDLAAGLRQAKETGARRVEITVTDELLADLRCAEGPLAELGLEVSGLALWALPNRAPDGAELAACIARIVSSVEATGRLGGRYLVIYFGPNAERGEEEAARRYADALGPALDAAAEAGIFLALENEFDSTGTDPTRTARFTRRVFDVVGAPEVFRINFDPCNFLIGGEEPYPLACEVLRGAIGHVHVKDVVPYDPARFPGDIGDWRVQRDRDGLFVPVPVGEGDVSWDALLECLAADHYAGQFALEPHIRPDRVIEGFKKSIAWLSARDMCP